MSEFDMTIGEFVEWAKSNNAAEAKIVGRKKDGTPTFIVVAVVGEKESAELIALLEKMRTVEQ